MFDRLYLLLPILLGWSSYVNAFVTRSPLLHQRLPYAVTTSLIAAAEDEKATATATATATSGDEIREMRVKELKTELSKLKISTDDVFEKEELVRRLLGARKTKDSEAICAPLYFTSLSTDLKIAAVNMNGGITVNPSDQPYATIEVEVQGGVSPFTLRLLLDTACSGFVLRPSTVGKYNLPKLSTPVTMTSAGGTAAATGLTQLNRFSLGGHSFGPLPAAVQDIGALPSSLDGIVGLSFMNQFSGVNFDFEKGQVSFYPKNTPLPKASKPHAAKGSMELIRHLGIYTVDVYLGSRGPVKMIVDSGAASSFLNWNGVEQLGIPRDDSSFLERISSPTAAMGSDNVAMVLTHRLYISSAIKFADGPGLSLKDAKRLGIDIGDIAILDSLTSQNVGGILGIDALMRCSSVRLELGGPNKEIIVYD